MNRSLKSYWSLGVILAGWFFGFDQTGLAAPAEPDLKITLGVYNYAHVESETLIRAEQEATRIYREMGVEISWVNRHLLPEKNQEDSPRPQKSDIAINVLPRAMAEGLGLQSRSLGLAPGTGRSRQTAYVFYDRIENVSREQIRSVAEKKVSRSATKAQILGLAMVHEVGHLLGLSHSPTGIMRDGWRWNDLLAAAYGSLVFTPQQAEVMRTEVQFRQ